MNGRYDSLVEDAGRMQDAVSNVRQDLMRMLERRRQADPTGSAFDLLILIRAASECWNRLQAAVASNNYYLLEAEVARVADQIQNMAEAMRTTAARRKTDAPPPSTP
jgi:hypothetical protein